ncbi:MAG: SDR family oxidoreductase [Sphingobium sp.]
MRDRVLLVAGGGGGIGRAVVKALAAAGAQVIAAGRSCRPTAPAGAVGYRPFDIMDIASCHALVADIVAGHGGLDGVVDCTNVGTTGMAGAFGALDPARFADIVTTGILPILNLCHAALPALTARGAGTIVAFASDSGKVAAPNQTMVGTTRAAVMMFVRSLALEAARDNVRVNCVSSSFVRDTPVYASVMAGPIASRARTAAARAGLGLPDAADMAALVAFLCSDAAAHMTGQVLSVNGGVTAA